MFFFHFESCLLENCHIHRFWSCWLWFWCQDREEKHFTILLSLADDQTISSMTYLYYFSHNIQQIWKKFIFSSYFFLLLSLECTTLYHICHLTHDFQRYHISQNHKIILFQCFYLFHVVFNNVADLVSALSQLSVSFSWDSNLNLIFADDLIWWLFWCLTNEKLLFWLSSKS